MNDHLHLSDYRPAQSANTSKTFTADRVVEHDRSSTHIGIPVRQSNVSDRIFGDSLGAKALRQKAKSLFLSVVAVMGSTPAAFAAGTGMPWETPLQTVEQSMTGPVAKAVGILAIVIFGLAFSFSEHGSVFRKAMGIIMGLSIAFSASSYGMTFLGFSGGAGF